MAADNEVVIVARAELDQAIKALEKLSTTAKKTGEEVKDSGRKVDQSLLKSAKFTENSIKNTSSLMRRMLNQLWGDVKALASLNALEGALKLSNQFQGAIKESIQLSDTIRRLGPAFGIAKQKFGEFQAYMSKGLGQIGASSEEAANALQGLAGKGVTGQDSILNLTKGAVTLAGASGERGNGGQIAGQLASVLQSQGRNVNDLAAQKALIGEVTAAVTTTGKGASEILGAMEQIFSTMDKGLRGKIGPEGMAQAAAVASTIGPAATKAMQEFLARSDIERMAMEQQGVKFFDKNGNIDVPAMMKFIQAGMGRIPQDPRKGVMSMGFSEEAAEGLVRLAERSKDVTRSLDNMKNATRDNEKAFRESMGLMDSFKANINNVTGAVGQFTKGLTQKVTDLLSGASQDTKTAAAVVGGGGILAAILAGGGLRGIGGAISGGLSGMASKAAYEGLTGEKAIPVFVVNASQIGGGGLGLGAGGGLAGLGNTALKATGVGLAALAGYQLGDKVLNPMIDKYTMGTTSEGYEGNAVERLLFKLDKLLGSPTGIADTHMRYQKMMVEINSKDPNLVPKVKPSRGVSN